jgi:hypothetical protein
MATQASLALPPNPAALMPTFLCFLCFHFKHACNITYNTAHHLFFGYKGGKIYWLAIHSNQQTHLSSLSGAATKTRCSHAQSFLCFQIKHAYNITYNTPHHVSNVAWSV